MKLYRLLIDSSKRQPGGHEYNFEWDLSVLSTARDLNDHTWMATVEWTDPIRYSEVPPTFGKNDAHLSTLFITCAGRSRNETLGKVGLARLLSFVCCGATSDLGSTT